MNTLTKNRKLMKRIHGSLSMPMLCLEIDGEIVQTHDVDYRFQTTEYWRHRWFYQYGLASKKNWQIFIAVQSPMGNFKPKRFSTKEFPYLIKSKKNQNDIEKQNSDATIGDIKS